MRKSRCHRASILISKPGNGVGWSPGPAGSKRLSTSWSRRTGALSRLPGSWATLPIAPCTTNYATRSGRDIVFIRRSGEKSAPRGTAGRRIEKRSGGWIRCGSSSISSHSFPKSNSPKRKRFSGNAGRAGSVLARKKADLKPPACCTAAVGNGCTAKDPDAAGRKNGWIFTIAGASTKADRVAARPS
jgi:hypothetical protein